MKKFIMIVAALVCMASIAWPATQTFNTIPSADANFISDMQTFLGDEEAVRFRYIFGDRVLFGGIGATSASLAHTISTCYAFPGGYYVYQAAKSHTYTASTRTFVYVRGDTSDTFAIAGATVTYDDNFVFAEMAAGADQPITPNITCLLMRVDTSGAAITAVSDLRALNTSTAMPAYDELSDFVTGFGSVPLTLHVSEVITVDGDTTIPDGFTLAVDSGGFYIDTGITLTINGGLVAPPNRQIFFGPGSVTFLNGVVPTGYPEWWGVTAGGSAATNATGFQAAIDSKVGELVFSNGTYEFSSGVTIATSDCPNYRGAGQYSTSNQSTVLSFTQSDSSDCITINDVDNVSFRDLLISGLSGTTGDGIVILDSFHCSFRDITVILCGDDGIELSGSSDYNMFENVYVSSCSDDCVEFNDAGGSSTPDFNMFNNCRLSSCSSIGYNIDAGSNNFILSGIVSSCTKAIDAENGNYGNKLFGTKILDPVDNNGAFDLLFNPANEADVTDVDQLQIGGVNNTIVIPNIAGNGNTITLPAVMGSFTGSYSILSSAYAILGKLVILYDQSTAITFGGDNVITPEWLMPGYTGDWNDQYKLYIYGASVSGTANNVRVKVTNDDDAVDLLDETLTLPTGNYMQKMGGVGLAFTINDNEHANSISVSITKENADVDYLYISHVVIVPEYNDMLDTVTWNPGSIDADATDCETKQLTVTGAKLGDMVIGSFSLDQEDLVLNCYVQAADTVECTLCEIRGNTVNLGEGTLRVRVMNGGE